MTEARFVTSPVDYDAIRRGYCPPSEHALIDQLQFGGARVVLGSDIGPTAYWLVMRGKPIKGRIGKLIMQQIENAIDAMIEDEAAAAAEAKKVQPIIEGGADALAALCP